MDKAAPMATPARFVLTATPIPRTLSLTPTATRRFRSDELAAGTHAHHHAHDHRAASPRRLGVARREVAAGHQGYVVYPVIEESKLELKAPLKNSSHCRENVFFQSSSSPLARPPLQREKEEVMQRFRKNGSPYLGRTTVVKSASTSPTPP